MAEAEDVIVDAARHATTYAMGLWRRNRARECPSEIALVDLRPRLELLLEAALGAHITIQSAALAPPRTMLSRLFERGKRATPHEPLPGTDGVAIFLPPRFDAAVASAVDLYRITALHQALRLLRGTAQSYPWGECLAVQDLYVLSETAAADAELATRLPGLNPALAGVRSAMLVQRASPDMLAEPLRSIEALYQAFLASGLLIDERPAAGPAQSLAWARARAAGFEPGGRYVGLAPDALLGAVYAPDASHIGRFTGAAAPAHDQPVRSTTLARRPRARNAAADEDDERTGAWMIQTTPPSEHVEDAMGLQRPVDKAPDEDVQGTGESISDLEELRLVHTPGSSREILTSDQALPLRGTRAPPPVAASSANLAYPEWDYSIAAYRERAAVVRTLEAGEGSAKWVASILGQRRAMLAQVRRRFEAIRSRRSVQHGEPEGDDIDLEAYVGDYGDRRARRPRNDRVYVTHRPARRDFAIMFVIDVSGSTEAWIGQDKRIIDLEKEALLVVATALDALRVRFAVQAFSGYGASHVRLQHIKGFAERFDGPVACRVAGLAPDEFTRAGAALRHASATLLREPAHRRLLLMLSDGKPNDCDHYEGRYGYEDMRQALNEARLQGIAPFCVTVDRQAARHLAGLFGSGNYTIVCDPQRLSAALLEWLQSVTLTM